MVDKNGVVFEVQRQQNALKAKERELEQVQRDLTSLKSNVAGKERLLQQKTKDCERLEERFRKALCDTQAIHNQAEAIKIEQRKLHCQVADLQRINTKLSEQVSALSVKGLSSSAQMASLQAELRTGRQEVAKKADESKTVSNMLRAKDRELTGVLAKLDWAKQVEGAKKTIEEEVLALRKRLADVQAEGAKALADVQAEVKALQQAQRAREADVAALERELAKAKQDRQAADEALQRKEAQLKGQRTSNAELSTELGLTRGELARVSAVAARVAPHSSPNKVGYKPEGTISVAQHVEEVKYLNGENMRLRDKIAQLERDLGMSQQRQERYRSVLAAHSLMSEVEFPGSPTKRRSGSAAPARAAAGATPQPAPAKVSAPPEAASLPADVGAGVRNLSVGGSPGKGGAAQHGSPVRDQDGPQEGELQQQQQPCEGPGEMEAGEQQPVDVQGHASTWCKQEADGKGAWTAAAPGCGAEAGDGAGGVRRSTRQRRVII